MKISFSILLLVFVFPLFSQVDRNMTRSSHSAIDSVLSGFVQSNELKQAQYSLFIRKLDTSQLSYSMEGERSLIPVSILKVLTTSVALDLLGENFRFQTAVTYNKNRVSSGKLEGDLSVIGTGDPTLGSWRFQSSPRKITDSIAAALIRNKINKIQGKIIVDASAFGGEIIPKNWKDYDYGNYYGAQANALTIHENQFSVTFNPGQNIGDATKLIALEPDIKGLNVVNEVTTGAKGSGDNVVIYSQPFDTLVVCRGTVPLGEKEFDVDASIPNPPLFFLQELKASLTRFNIQFDSLFEICYYPSKAHSDTLVVFKSPDLKTIVYHTNLKSINLYAEALIKTIGRQSNGVGSYSSGIREVKKWLISNGINASLLMFDGSGLCPDNQLSAKLMVDMLVLCRNKPWFPALEASFPISGKNGSIANICKNCVAEGRVKAKSGFMKNVRSYAGYYENLKGEKFAFCFIVNNFSSTPYAVKKRIEALFINLVKYS